MYIGLYCEGCRSWSHPKCVFENKDLALTLTPGQRKSCNLLDDGFTTTMRNSMQIFYYKICSLHQGSTATNDVVGTDDSSSGFNESVISVPDHDKKIVNESVTLAKTKQLSF